MSDGMLTEPVERILADTVTPAVIEAAERRELPAQVLATLDENGVFDLLVPEAAGGVGATMAEAVAVMRAFGAAAAPGPLLETMLGRALLAEAGLEPGRGPLALAFANDPGALWRVPWGGLVERIVVVGDAGVGVAVRAEAHVTAGAGPCGEPRDDIVSSRPVALHPIGPGAFERAALLRAGQIMGAIGWVFERSADYANERQQFGKEIGKFQAVQQMLAVLADNYLAGSGITEAAAEAGEARLIAAARSRLGEASDRAIEVGHQVHGALGFSREYALNYRTRRLMSWRDEYGGVGFWRARLARMFAGLSREAVWPAVSGVSG